MDDDLDNFVSFSKKLTTRDSHGRCFRWIGNQLDLQV